MINENQNDINDDEKRRRNAKKLENDIAAFLKNELDTTGMTISALKVMVKCKQRELEEKRQCLENYEKILEENNIFIDLLGTKIYYSKNKDLMLNAYEILVSEGVFTEDSHINRQLQIPIISALTRKSLKFIEGNEINMTPQSYIRKDMIRLLNENKELLASISLLKREIIISKKDLASYKEAVIFKIGEATDDEITNMKPYFIPGNKIIQDYPIKKK